MIPYQSPVDHKIHRYFVDFLVMYKTKSGHIKKALIEVKPHKQRFMPQTPKVRNARYLNEVTTYLVNQAKWAAATKWCEQREIEFWVLDEYDLGIAKRKE
ncbi:hypothetical protein [Synechococcus phage BUCT-ZZ01]|nr:hypothetical protein [Synechococcus phage BUCT-ZZ01]